MRRTFTLEFVEQDGSVSKVYGTLPASPAPGVPTALSLEEATAGTVALSWADDGFGTSWVVYRDGVSVATVTEQGYTDSAVTPETVYSYQVQATNSAGASALTDALEVTTLSNSSPVWSIVDQAGVIGQSYSLDFNTVCADEDSHALSFSLTSGTVPGLAIGPTGVYTGTPTAAGSFALTFRANDGYGTVDASITFTVIDPDSVAPTVPTGLAAAVSGSTVDLTWNASTDAANSVASYKVYRNGVLRSTVTVTSYSESGVPDGTYSYTVSAVDSSANANESAQSTAAVAVVSTVPLTPDTPISFTATAVSTSQIDLSWAPGPNGPAPTSYTLQWNTVPLGGTWTALTLTTPTSTTYSHTGRAASTTYYYRVRATASAVNSAFTSVINATTFSAQTGADYVVTTSAAVPTTGAITVRFTKQSNGAVTTFVSAAGNTGDITITRAAIGAAAGDVIEFSGGTYPSMVMQGFNLGSRTNRTVFRNKAGEVAVIRRQGKRAAGASRGFVFTWKSCKYVTVDGSNGFPAWSPWMSESYYCFVVVSYAANATSASKDPGPSSCFKLAADGTTKTDEFLIKRVRLEGGYTVTVDPSNPDRNVITANYSSSFSGGISSNMAISRSTNQWQDNIEVTECYAHKGLMQLCYIGSNWVADDIPLRGVWVHHNCSEDVWEDGFTCKSWIAHSTAAGYPENAIHHNYVRHTGWNIAADTNQRCGFSAISCTVNIYNNHVEDAGSGRTPAAGFSGTQASGIAVGAQTGPAAGFTYGPTGDRATIDSFLVRAYNNVSRDNEKAGINATQGSGTAPITFYAYQNTSIDNGTNGIGVASSIGGGLVKNNICLSNSGSDISSSVTNNNNLTGATVSTYLNTDLTLKAAQPIAGDSVLDVSKAATDFTDAARDASPDKGAYDF